MVTLEGVLLFIFLLLPGAHARVTALRSMPFPWAEAYRSPTQELVEILFYSLANTLLAGLSLLTLAMAFADVGPVVRDVIRSGPEAISQLDRVNGAIWVLGYLGFSIAIAEVIGSAQLFTRVREMTAFVLGQADDFTHSTVWYWAIDATLKKKYRVGVGARVMLDDGTLYLGELVNYPIVGNEEEKDIVLEAAERFNPVTREFEFVGGPVGRVLLNTRRCRSIEVGPSGPVRAPRLGLDWSRASQLGQWLATLIIGSFALAKLLQQPSMDSLDQLVTFVAACVCSFGLLGAIRLLLAIDNRWDTRPAQLAWFTIGSVLIISSALVALGVETAWLGPFLATGIAIGLVVRAEVAPLPTIPGTPG